MTRGRSRKEIDAREEKAVRMRAAGASYKEIGKSLECSQATAARLVARALGAQPLEHVELLRDLEATRLDLLWRHAMLVAVESGDAAAYGVCVRISQARMQLLGLVVPPTEPNGPNMTVNVYADVLPLTPIDPLLALAASGEVYVPAPAEGAGGSAASQSAGGSAVSPAFNDPVRPPAKDLASYVSLNGSDERYRSYERDN